MNKQNKHMKLIKNKRKTINIPKQDFDIIKNYCEKNALTMSKWIVKKLLEVIKMGEL